MSESKGNAEAKKYSALHRQITYENTHKKGKGDTGKGLNQTTVSLK